jgi:hypothetical protein
MVSKTFFSLVFELPKQKNLKCKKFPIRKGKLFHNMRHTKTDLFRVVKNPPFLVLSTASQEQGCQIFLGTILPKGCKKYQMTTKLPKCP